MKKIVVTTLALIYLTTSVGATMHIHYCMGKIVSWDFGLENNSRKQKKCPGCGMYENQSEHINKGCYSSCKRQNILWVLRGMRFTTKE